MLSPLFCLLKESSKLSSVLRSFIFVQLFCAPLCGYIFTNHQYPPYCSWKKKQDTVNDVHRYLKFTSTSTVKYEKCCSFRSIIFVIGGDIVAHNVSLGFSSFEHVVLSILVCPKSSTKGITQFVLSCICLVKIWSNKYSEGRKAETLVGTMVAIRHCLIAYCMLVEEYSGL